MTRPDQSLARRARAGDRQALADLYERYRKRLFGFLMRSAGERAAAEDLFQEVWVKAIQAIGSYDTARGTFRAWLFRIAANAAVDRARREAVRTTGKWDPPNAEFAEGMIDELPAAGVGPERESASRETGVAIAEALAALPPEQRAALLLRHQQGLSYTEIAIAVGVPEGTAKTRVHRAVESLRATLKEWSDE